MPKYEIKGENFLRFIVCLIVCNILSFTTILCVVNQLSVFFVVFQ